MAIRDHSSPRVQRYFVQHLEHGDHVEFVGMVYFAAIDKLRGHSVREAGIGDTLVGEFDAVTVDIDADTSRVGMGLSDAHHEAGRAAAHV